MLFHQRHMLIGCGMEDDIGPVLGKDMLDPFGVSDIGDTRDDFG